MRTSLLMVSAGLVAASLAAQGSRYSPARYKSVEGNSASSWPLVHSSKSTVPGATNLRYMQMHDDLGKTPMAIKSMSFRKDGGSYNFWTTPAYRIELELDMSNTPMAGSNMSRTFDSNHGQDRLKVIAKKWFSLPAVPTLPGRPQPDVFFRISFDKPFAFKGNSLCWDMKVHNNTYSTKSRRRFSLDRAYQSNSSRASHFGFRDRYGRGCYGSFQYHTPPYMFAYPRYRQSTGNIEMYMYMYYLPPGNSPAAFVVGLSDKKLGSVSLPFDLGPLGAPGCSIYSSADLVIPVTTDPSGYVRYPASGNLSFPWNPWFEGKPLYFQAVSLTDKSANAAGIVTSAGYVAYLPMVYQNGLPGNYVYRSGPTAFTNPTGNGASTSSRYLTIVGFHAQ